MSQLDQLLTAQKTNQQSIIDVDEPVVKLVIFRLADQYFAFYGAVIKEVIPGDTKVYFLPAMPASVEGVMNIRGDIESVISLYELLQLSAVVNRATATASSILLGKTNAMHSGLRVDQLLDVVDVPTSQLQPPPPSLPEYLQPFVTSLLVFNGLPVTLLDLDAVFLNWLKGQSKAE
ncbi:MAG TPA: chemotaxis protein CheW [Marinospirillum sp.]|uniref:chemotaxis protein CheW n=1 Tax=Marinospirillum sp. TaxID=2183934 RepID=UPI002B47FFD6|nr:chemotaxis protein CheW [Marinospirillum sp.]HKM15683.1 chemotaxis protein CheW [Marinospirillum sp.]